MTSTRSLVQQELTTSDIFRLAWPMAIKAIFLHGTIIVDGWLVSGLGEEALAAMGIAAALGGILLGIIFAFSHAMQIRTAQFFGNGSPVLMKSVLSAGLVISLSIGILGALMIAIFGQTLIGYFAQSPQIADSAWSYLAIFSIVVLAESIGQCLASFFNGCGKTKIPLIGYCISVPINLISSYALIYGVWGMPELGIMGAALGSAIAVSTQTAYLWIRATLENGQLRHVIGWHKDSFRKTIQRHFVFSLPIAATFISANLATHVCTLIYANMALSAFAALTLIAPWNMVVGQISMQWTQASGILTAQQLGNKAGENTLDRYLSKVWRGAFVAGGAAAGVFVILGLFIDAIYAELQPETRTILLSFIPIMIIVQFPRATNAVCGNTLRASGDTIYVMNIFLWSQWLFRVPITALFVLVFDFSAFWIISLIIWEELIKFYPFHGRLWTGAWKRATVLDEN